MSDEESEANDASQSEEQEEDDSAGEQDKGRKGQKKAKPGSAHGKPAQQKGKNQNGGSAAGEVKGGKESGRVGAATNDNSAKGINEKNRRLPPDKTIESPASDENRAHGSSGSDSDDSSSHGSQQPTGVSSGAGGNVARMTFDGGAISDDEANSWEDSVSESEGSLRGDNYYDEEDYDEESPSPRKPGASLGSPHEETKTQDQAATEDDYGSEDGGRLVMNVYCTEYECIKKVARKVLGYKLREYPEDHDGAIRKGEHNQKVAKEWDVSWHDLSITPDFLAKLNPWQKVNHYPGMYSITRKNHLARNLMRMKRAFPDEFNFFPATWVLPGDNIDFRNQFHKKNDSKKEEKKQKKQTFIVKPDGLSQGKGIFLSRRVEKILANIATATEEEGIGGWVVQHYLDQPHLVDDLKYDLRIYVLLNGVMPLRAYIHEEGLARFCTEPYRKPTARNMDNLFMHLTNYAINKLSSAYEAGEASSGDEESGHKRSLKAIMNILEACGADQQKLMRQIKDIIVKTLATSQPYLAHLYRSCQPEDLDNSMCFQILGFDIMIDKKFKPWLIEVNQSPSFATDSPLDYKCKKAVLTDTFSMLNCSTAKRKKILAEQRKALEARILTGKQAKMEPEEKARLRDEKLKKRFAYEEKRRGQWELIYPWPEEARNERYGEFIRRAQEIWDEFTTGKGKRTSMEDRRQQQNNLNRQGTSKNTIPAQKAPLSNTGSTITLRTVTHKFAPLNRNAAGASSKDLSQPVGRAARANEGAAAATTSQDRLPQTSQVKAVEENTTDIQLVQPEIALNSDRQGQRDDNNIYKLQQIGQLDVIEQHSQECSPLPPQKLLETDSSERMGSTKPFQLNLKQQFPGQQDFITEHITRLTKPTAACQLPAADLKHRDRLTKPQSNQFLLQLDTQAKPRAQPYNQVYSVPGGPGANPSSLIQHQKKQQLLSQGAAAIAAAAAAGTSSSSGDNKMSFLQRATMEANQRSQDHQDMRSSHEKWNQLINGVHAQPGRFANDSKVSHRERVSIPETGDRTPPPKIITKQGQQQARKQVQQELEAFTGFERKRPAARVYVNSNDPGSPGSAKSGGPMGSADGRQSLRNAGSEQMNFLIATKQQTAKTQPEQLTNQQVPQWVGKVGGSALDSSNRVQQLKMLSKENAQGSGAGQGAPFSASRKAQHPEAQAQQASMQLQHTKLIQHQPRAAEMSQAAYESFKRSDQVTPEISELAQRPLAMTEQKLATNYPHVLAYDESQDNRTMITTSVKHAHGRQDENLESQPSSRIGESTEFSGDNGPAMGMTQSHTSGFRYGDSYVGLSKKSNQKQAIKMTQMPIFLSDSNMQQPKSHNRIESKKKDSPKNKFRALPGIAYPATQPDIMSGQAMVGQTLKSRTVAKNSSHKLDEMKVMLPPGTGSRFEGASAQISKTGLKPQPNYGGHVLSSDMEEQYFQRRQAIQQSNSVKASRENMKSTRIIQGGLPVSHQPLKHAPNLKQLQTAQVTVLPLNGIYSHGGGSSANNGADGAQNKGQGQRRVEILNSENAKQQTTTMTNNTSGGNQSSQLASQPTPYTLYQQYGQQQRRCAQPHAPLTSAQQQQQFVPQKTPQQHPSGKGLVVVAPGGGGGGGAGGSHGQQNQFILQKNNNQRQQPQQQPKHNYQVPSQHNQIINPSSSHLMASQTSTYQPQTNNYAHMQKYNAQQKNAATSCAHHPHQQQRLQGQVRTSSSRVDKAAAGGSGANNRRLGRALGQGKSMGVAAAQSQHNQQKSRGQINPGPSYGGPQIMQYQNRTGKASIGVISSSGGGGQGGNGAIIPQQNNNLYNQSNKPQNVAGKPQAATQDGWQRNTAPNGQIGI